MIYFLIPVAASGIFATAYCVAISLNHYEPGWKAVYRRRLKYFRIWVYQWAMDALPLVGTALVVLAYCVALSMLTKPE